ncbi:hypothetical protein [Vibrio parahaemolyticus]|uniref:hypothetical protein n=1 Tax=Vibrio parahaemolyticus TaxID=670 RepID=UPI003D815600
MKKILPIVAVLLSLPVSAHYYYKGDVRNGERLAQDNYDKADLTKDELMDLNCFFKADEIQMEVALLTELMNPLYSKHGDIERLTAAVYHKRLGDFSTPIKTDVENLQGELTQFDRDCRAARFEPPAALFSYFDFSNEYSYYGKWFEIDLNRERLKDWIVDCEKVQGGYRDLADDIAMQELELKSMQKHIESGEAAGRDMSNARDIVRMDKEDLRMAGELLEGLERDSEGMECWRIGEGI